MSTRARPSVRPLLSGVAGAALMLRVGEVDAQAHPPAAVPGGLFHERSATEEPPEIPERATELTTPHRQRSVHLFGGVSVDFFPGARPGALPTFTLTTGVDSEWLRVESYFGGGPEGSVSEGGAEARYSPWLAGVRACVWVREWPGIWNGLGLSPCVGAQAVINGSGRGAANVSPTVGALLRADLGEVGRVVALTEVGFGQTPGRIVRTDFDRRTGERREVLLFETAPVYVMLSVRIEFATPQPPARSSLPVP